MLDSGTSCQLAVSVCVSLYKLTWMQSHMLLLPVYLCKRDLLKNHVRMTSIYHHGGDGSGNSAAPVTIIPIAFSAINSTYKMHWNGKCIIIKKTHTRKMKHELVINNMIKLQSNCGCGCRCRCCSNQLLRHFIPFNFMCAFVVAGSWSIKLNYDHFAQQPSTLLLHRSVAIKNGFNVYILRCAHFCIAVVLDSLSLVPFQFVQCTQPHTHTHKLFAHWKMLNVGYLVFN